MTGTICAAMRRWCLIPEIAGGLTSIGRQNFTAEHVKFFFRLFGFLVEQCITQSTKVIQQIQTCVFVLRFSNDFVDLGLEQGKHVFLSEFVN